MFHWIRFVLVKENKKIYTHLVLDKITSLLALISTWSLMHTFCCYLSWMALLQEWFLLWRLCSSVQPLPCSATVQRRDPDPDEKWKPVWPHSQPWYPYGSISEAIFHHVWERHVTKLDTTRMWTLCSACQGEKGERERERERDNERERELYKDTPA